MIRPILFGLPHSIQDVAHYMYAYRRYIVRMWGIKVCGRHATICRRAT